METNYVSESNEGSRDALKGLGQRLKLHIIVPIVYALVLVTAFIVANV